jgi:hypothetical protein
VHLRQPPERERRDRHDGVARRDVEEPARREQVEDVSRWETLGCRRTP